MGLVGERQPTNSGGLVEGIKGIMTDRDLSGRGKGVHIIPMSAVLKKNAPGEKRQEFGSLNNGNLFSCINPKVMSS